MQRRTATTQRRPGRSRPRRQAALALALAALLSAPVGPARAEAVDDVAELASAVGRGVALVQEGIVSWYGAQFHDRKTASGEPFDMEAMTMAHPTLPFGTQVRVTNLRNGRSVVVRVNDRGPFVGKRVADLSKAAAAELGFMRRGVARARIEVIGAE